MSIYGTCMNHPGREATHGVVFKNGRFEPANDRFGADAMTVAILDIVYCADCASDASADANANPPDTGLTCDTCEGPAGYRVSGSHRGDKCVGHVQKYLRGAMALFSSVEALTSAR